MSIKGNQRVCPNNPLHRNLKTIPISYPSVLKNQRNSKATVYLKNVPGIKCLDCMNEGLFCTYPDVDIDKLLQNDILPTLLCKLDKANAITSNLCIDLSYEESETQKDRPFRILNPRVSLQDLIFPKEFKEYILQIINICKNANDIINSPGFKTLLPKGRTLVFNFHGPPGTGKTATVEAIAMALNTDIISVSYPELESKYVGDTPKNIKSVFEVARKESLPILFDEADSFLSKRVTNITQSADYGVNISRSVLLKELEQHEGDVFFCTNLLENYDRAFERRIFYSLEFVIPTLEIRKDLFRYYLKKSFPQISEMDWKLFAEQSGEGFTGADIVDVILLVLFDLYSQNMLLPIEGQIISAINFILSRKSSDQENKVLGKLENLVDSDS